MPQMRNSALLFTCTCACAYFIKTSPTIRSILGLPAISESSANLALWSGKWSSDQTRWQRDDYHHSLLKHYASTLKGRDNILVPLCGKTKDLQYLTGQGHDVVGIEGIHKAISEFGAENADLVAFDSLTDTGEYKPYFETYSGTDRSTSKSLKVLRGDFFLSGAAVEGSTTWGGQWGGGP
ncbi:hypothetical protein TrRE_jg12984 [Triparma retinervis]|uniref:Thiopurine S-methyltransferase n=1 Tax=Triparma retinervis TaxID=2557542 RepID=A0A9W6ZH58_9STRA|nr:hypothetical protein TrRE_jg12984 [Triparma retinervis]